MSLYDEERIVTQDDADSAAFRLQLIKFFLAHQAERVDEMAGEINAKGGNISFKDISNAKGFMADLLGDLFHAEKCRCEETLARFYGAMEARHEQIERSIVRELQP